MNNILNAIRIVKPMKVGFLIKDNKLLVIGYNSKVFNDVHIVKALDNINKDDGYLELYFKDLESLFIKNNILDLNLDVKKGLLLLKTDDSVLEVDSLGSEAREKKEITNLYNSNIDQFHSIQVNNINLEQIFKDFLLKNKESVESEDNGFFFSRLNKNNYFISMQKKVIQLLKNRSDYSYHGDVSDISTYKIPSIIRKILALYDNNTLYISETKNNVLYIDDNETYIIAPKKGFKYIDSVGSRTKKKEIVKNFMSLKRKVILKISDKKDFLEFLENSREDFFLYLKGDLVKSKKSIHGNYFKANDVFEVIENDYDKNDEIMFSLKINTIKTILENGTINYLTFDLNSSLAALSSDSDLSNTYNIYIFKLSNYN